MEEYFPPNKGNYHSFSFIFFSLLSFYIFHKYFNYFILLIWLFLSYKYLYSIVEATSKSYIHVSLISYSSRSTQQGNTAICVSIRPSPNQPHVLFPPCSFHQITWASLRQSSYIIFLIHPARLLLWGAREHSHSFSFNLCSYLVLRLHTNLLPVSLLTKLRLSKTLWPLMSHDQGRSMGRNSFWALIQSVSRRAFVRAGPKTGYTIIKIKRVIKGLNKGRKRAFINNIINI